MEKGKFAKLAEFFGIRVNEDALELIENKYDAEMPGNWADMSEEEQKAWKEKHMMKDNTETPAVPAPAAKPPVTANTQAPAPKPDENLLWFNKLIENMGGPEAFQGLLMGAVDAVKVHQNSQAGEKETVIAALVLNSNGTLTADELKDMDLPVLQKMAKVIVPQQLADYSMLSAGPIKANKDDVAVMPDIFAAEFWKEN